MCVLLTMIICTGHQSNIRSSRSLISFLVQSLSSQVHRLCTPSYVLCCFLSLPITIFRHLLYASIMNSRSWVMQYTICFSFIVSVDIHQNELLIFEWHMQCLEIVFILNSREARVNLRKCHVTLLHSFQVSFILRNILSAIGKA